MNFTDIIIKKRNKMVLSEEELTYFAEGAANNTIPDYQLSAMLMAICINSLNDEETTYLTSAMTKSGDILNFDEIDGLKIDKHSTGGVGDTTTLILAPLTASLGLPVVKMSGRGLGHTGGTLDKLEAIPGFNVNISPEKAIKQVKKHGIVIMGQTARLAPADKTLYALRDVTGTVESIPLIASSIMSKKIAAGADGIVLDVKLGHGAFMKNIDDAVKLGETMLNIGKNLNKKMSVLITDMNEPLGLNIGNSLEVIDAVEVLKGNREGRLKEVSLALGAKMLVMGGIAENTKNAVSLLERNISNGMGIEKLEELISIQGGNPKIVNDYSLFHNPKENLVLKSDYEGFVSEVNAYEIGRAALETGAGRKTKADIIDLSAGIVMKIKTGDYIKRGDEIAEIFSSSEDKCVCAADIIKNAVKTGEKPDKKSVIYKERNL